MHRVWSRDTTTKQEDDIPYDTLEEARAYTAGLVRSARRNGLRVVRLKGGSYAMYPKTSNQLAGFVSMEVA